MSIPTVAFDEAGNTGANLLDSEQPCFALASVYFTYEEAMQILGPALCGQAQEVHFAQLKRRNSGRIKILDVLSSPLLTPDRAKISIVHKPYMVTTKIVDMLIEHLLYRDGIDLYDRGANIALSNILFYCIPTFCGNELFEKIQQSFIKMLRTKANPEIMGFYSAVYEARKRCSHPEFEIELKNITATRQILRDCLDNWRHTDLDPAIPCLSYLSRVWSDQFGEAFAILHDQSKAIAFDKAFVEALMDPDAPDIRMGRDRRTGPLFIKSTGVTFVDSKDVMQIQLADILAGSVAYLWGGYINPDYAATAAIFYFQAFPHRFLPEMQELSGIEKLETPCQATIFRQFNQ